MIELNSLSKIESDESVGNPGGGYDVKVEFPRKLQQVDLNQAARRHPLAPSGTHFPVVRVPPSPFVAGLQELGRPSPILENLTAR